MATAAEPAPSSLLQPRRMLSSHSLIQDEDINTLPDPRSRAMSPANVSGMPSPAHHPDLDQEVAALSTKLINAINHQTSLDDTLSATRHELEAAHGRAKELEAQVARQKEILSGDVWMRKSVVEVDKNKLLVRIAEEKKLRADAEKDKKKIEQELENLTAALFEEANKMVIAAKEEAKAEQDAIQRKNDLLKAQLADTEGLLRSQQEQLTELKLVMEQIASERDDHSATAPSSPGFSKFDAKDDDLHLSEGGSQAGQIEPFSPTYPTSLTHLLQPILRTDLSSYDDFITLAKTSRKPTTARTSSGSYNGLGISGAVLNASSASVSGSPAMTATSANTSPQTPHTPASSISVGSTSISSPLPALKETKFYKRALAEDVEPTLRLDIAPGLSWLARRSVLSAVTEGTLVVEPVPTTGAFVNISKPQFYPCSLCGETRRAPEHLRNHRFRTSETDSAQRYPLCKYCLTRVRATCDYLGFLRMVKDGHWRADDADSERAAWEESVRLREQMFWSRIGGGVIPAAHLSQAGSIGEKSPRVSEDTKEPHIQIIPAADLAPQTAGAQDLPVVEGKAESKKEEASELEEEQPKESQEDSAQSLEPTAVDSGKEEPKRLSLTIPGALDA